MESALGGFVAIVLTLVFVAFLYKRIRAFKDSKPQGGSVDGAGGGVGGGGGTNQNGEVSNQD